MNNIENIKNITPGQTFTHIGTEMTLLRHCGEVTYRESNRYGGLTGNKGTAVKVAVEVTKPGGHKRFAYRTFRLGTEVRVVN